MTQIPIPEMTVILQEEVKGTDDKFSNVVVNDDLVSCVIGSWNFANKNFNLTLWDENSIPTYKEIGMWTYDDAVNKMIELTK